MLLIVVGGVQKYECALSGLRLRTLGAETAHSRDRECALVYKSLCRCRKMGVESCADVGLKSNAHLAPNGEPNAWLLDVGVVVVAV